jgi:hypothetical protein
VTQAYDKIKLEIVGSRLEVVDLNEPLREVGGRLEIKQWDQFNPRYNRACSLREFDSDFDVNNYWFLEPVQEALKKILVSK